MSDANRKSPNWHVRHDSARADAADVHDLAWARVDVYWRVRCVVVDADAAAGRDLAWARVDKDCSVRRVAAEADEAANRSTAWARQAEDWRLGQAVDALEAAQHNVCRAHGFPPHVERMIEAALVALRACARERP